MAVKKNRHNYKSPVYRVNPYLLPSLDIIEAEVDRTMDIVSVIEQITPESLVAIGYDDHITEKICQSSIYDGSAGRHFGQNDQYY